MTNATVAVIGAGPIGIELALALKREQIDYIQLEAHEIGRTIELYPPGTEMFTAPSELEFNSHSGRDAGLKAHTRESYLAYLHSIISSTGLAIQTGMKVSDIQSRGKGFTLTAIDKHGNELSYDATYVVMATGGLSRPRAINIPGENLPHVSHYLPPGIQSWTNRRALIVGGRNSALEAVLYLYKAGAQVTMSYRRAAFEPPRVKAKLVKKIMPVISSGHVRALFETIPVSITDKAVKLYSLRTGESSQEQADSVLLMTGYTPDLELCRRVGVRLEGAAEAPCFNPLTMETNVPGIYVAGTICGGLQDDVDIHIGTCHIHVERIIKALKSLS